MRLKVSSYKETLIQQIDIAYLHEKDLISGLTLFILMPPCIAT